MPNKILAFMTAVLISFLITPLIKKWAEKVGAMDIPKDSRRVHKIPTPRLGGLAIYFSFVISVVAFGLVDKRLFGVLLGATVIVIMGYFDDIKPLSAKLKFFIQILAAILVVYNGIKIDVVTNPLYFITHDRWITLGIWSYPITVLWIVGVTNAINLIDGLDGLAAGVSTIASATLFIVALFTNQPAIAMLTLVLAGATAGFLPYNFNPAKIFMGDTGALFLGFMLSVISIMGVLKSAAALAILVPVVAIGFPIFDTLFAMVRRVANGKSMMEADKGHLHHRLLDKGLSQKQAVLTLYSISAVLGISAVAIVESKLKLAFWLVVAIFLLVAMGARYLDFIDIKHRENKADI